MTTTPATTDELPSFPERSHLYDTLNGRIVELEQMLAQSPFFLQCELPLFHVLSVQLKLHGDPASAQLMFRRAAEDKDAWRPLSSAPLHVRVHALLYAEAIAKCMREQHAKRIGDVQKAIADFDALRPTLATILQERTS